MRRQGFASAALALEGLALRRRPRATIVKRLVRRAAAIHGVAVHGQLRLESMLTEVFRNYTSALGGLLDKALKVADDGEAILVFADVYHADEEALQAAAERCSDAGLETSAFVLRFPPKAFAEAHVPDRAVTDKMINTGYAAMYRGRLAGLRFVVPSALPRRTV